jgi:DNA-binding transcriptional ArsR family regulator
MTISTHATGLLRQLQHPVRLPILLELARHDAGATELARQLGVSFDTVHHALLQLTKAGLVEIVRQEPVSGSNLSRRVYRGTRSDWPQFVAYLEVFARAGGAGGELASTGR